ncbi:unnamed protein product, partial [Ectocarpus sp. 8 AP-2014]
MYVSPSSKSKARRRKSIIRCYIGVLGVPGEGSPRDGSAYLVEHEALVARERPPMDPMERGGREDSHHRKGHQLLEAPVRGLGVDH